MKKFLYPILLILLFASCEHDDPPARFDFSVSGIEKVDVKVEETKTLRLLVTCNNIAPENVYLTLQDVPSGITYAFDKVGGVPEFASNLELKISRNVEGGLHKLKLVCNSSIGIKEFYIEVTVDKSLSAAFTIYNAIDYDPEDVSSNLLDSALINVYRSVAAFDSGVPSYKAYTEEDGKAYFYKLPTGNYLFTVEKDDLSNVVQKRQVGNTMLGYIVAGMFRTSQEIINSSQPKAKIGDLKFRDLNADSKIDESDLGRYDLMSIYDGELNEKVIWVGK
jgi:hypothetical protein